jgi:hypothetical protein
MGGIKYRESDSRSIIKLSTYVPGTNLDSGMMGLRLDSGRCRFGSG